MIRPVVISVVLLHIAVLALAQYNVGDDCVQEHDGASGKCKKSVYCPQALEGLPHRPPTTCGYAGNEPIVCCVPRVAQTGSRPSRPRPPVASGRPPPFTPLNSGQRVSERKCDEYSTRVTHVVTAVALTSDPQIISNRVAKCEYSKVPLIVGGNITMQGEFPHMAAIGWTKNGVVSWSCGGSLISDRYVMTAAHCSTFQSVAPDVIRLGEQNLHSDDDGANPEDIYIESITSHPEYRYPSKYNDIALIRLSRPATLSKDIRPACLYQSNDFSVDKTVATGWGRIDYAEDPSDELLKVSLNLFRNEQCAPLYADLINRKLKRGIIDTQLCAGDIDGGKDTCQGDSGGPIQIASQSNKCIFHVIGVTSFGKGCGAPNSPGVYTRVSKYIDWIEGIVWPNE